MEELQKLIITKISEQLNTERNTSLLETLNQLLSTVNNWLIAKKNFNE